MFALAVLSYAAAAAASAPDYVYYDAAGVWPECCEATQAYLTQCAEPSDFFMYLQAQAPTLAKINATTSCKALGYEYVSPGTV